MSEETYIRLSRKGKRRARYVRDFETLLMMLAIVAAGYIGANGMGLLIKVLGV